ncbi:potassium transporter 12 isoform X2 [Olea europaea subsp. europaea]|uniref:Potassium transporter 12 isoform X2 n=1 Tax=Olea europaea subsp. europaea TaxID=158383 RepID=A0A8S0TIH8_OLEEU|nr:potassium transporter 12 isoform X2 [Olea europaea subsp. europaea]
MYVLNYGSVLKFRSELRRTIWMEFMLELGAYLGIVKEDYNAFEQLFVESLEKFSSKEALELALGSNPNESEFDHIFVRSRNRVVQARDLTRELMHDQVSDEARMFAWPPGVMSADEDPSFEYELSALREATTSGFTYLLSHGDMRAKKNSLFLKKLIINYFYALLRNNCR